MTTDKIKDALKQTTSEAVREGCFGLPFMLVDQGRHSNDVETYFGSDRFEVMASKLGMYFNASNIMWTEAIIQNYSQQSFCIILLNDCQYI